MLGGFQEAEVLDIENETAPVAVLSAKIARTPVTPTRSHAVIAAAKPYGSTLARREPDPSPSRPQRAELPSPKEGHNTALGLLEDVKRFIPVLIRENKELRDDYVSLQERSRAEVGDALDQAREWQSVADDLTAEVISLEAVIAELKTQLQKAESLAAVDQDRLSKASQDAAEAECLSRLFEDTIVSSFGIGTMFQEAMARLSNPAAA